MALHLLKLCVGCDSIEDLEEWIALRLKEARRAGKPPEHSHVTRMIPKRAEELVDGGSLYWVIRGNVQVRQQNPRRPPVPRQGRHPALPACAGAQDQRDRVAAAPCVSGVALPEAGGSAARPGRRARRACGSCRRNCAAISRIWGCSSRAGRAPFRRPRRRRRGGWRGGRYPRAGFPCGLSSCSASPPRGARARPALPRSLRPDRRHR